MNKTLLATFLISFATFSAWQSGGQEASMPLQLQSPQRPSPDRYGASFRMGFNITANFKTGFGSSNPGPATGGGQDRTYDDGYNKVDSSGNAFGYTRYWGYDHDGNQPGFASQYDPNNGTITMNSASGSVSSTGRDGDPQPGFELTYNRELGRNKNCRWGFEAAFNYMNVGIHDAQSLTANGTLISDTFQLPPLEGGGFVAPPPAPYSHGPDLSPSGNPVLGDLPSRNTSALAASITGFRDFDANVFAWRLGPYAEIPLGSKASLFLSGGLALGAVASEFNFNELILTGTGTVPATGSSSHADFLVGGYIGGALDVALSKKCSVFGGVQFQSAGSYTHREGNSQARLNLSESLFVTLGLGFSF